VIVWLNGPHGVGKSSVARRLARQPGWRLFDPETIGHRLVRETGERPDDFKDLPAWRERTASALRDASATVVVPMTLSDPVHLDNIVGALRREGRDVRHLTLMARPETLRGRIGRRLDWPKSKRWALVRVDTASAAFADPLFEPLLWTDDIGIAEVVERVLAAVAGEGVS
jgi:predicted kinase